jgi:hypothetical protein
MKRREASTTGGRWWAGLLAAGILAGVSALPAVAATRVVLAEEFTSTG